MRIAYTVLGEETHTHMQKKTEVGSRSQEGSSYYKTQSKRTTK